MLNSLLFLADNSSSTDSFFKDLHPVIPGTWSDIDPINNSIDESKEYWFPEGIKQNITSPKSYIAGGANVGIKTDIEELDFGILWSESLKTTCAGVFTKNSIVCHSVTAYKLNLKK